MIRARVTPRGFPVVVAKLQGAPAKVLDAAEVGLKNGLAFVVKTSQLEFLQGPRPLRLGEVTTRLRNSIVYKVTRDGTKVTGRVGTNVVYGAFHEFGFKGIEHVKGFPRTLKRKGQTIEEFVKGHNRRVNYKGRPFIRPALDKGLPLIIEAINKQIEAA